MFTIAKAKKKSSQLKPGRYLAKVTDVKISDKYVNNGAFIVCYCIFDMKGSFVQNFQETILNNDSNARTQELVQLMQECNAQYVEDLINCELEIEVKLNTLSKGYALPTICSRKLVKLPTQEDTSET